MRMHAGLDTASTAPRRFATNRRIADIGLAVLACVALSLLPACSREPAPLPAAPAAAFASVPQHVLIAADRGQDVEWRLVDAVAGSSSPLGSAPADAELWALDDGPGDFYFAAGNDVWRGNWRSGVSAPQRLASRPASTGPVHAAWIDTGDGALHALEMREPTPAEAKGMKAEPPDARPYWAVLWRLDQGAWSMVARRATSWGSDGSLGPGVFDDLRRERGRSARALDDAASCVRLCDRDAPAPVGVDPAEAQEWRAWPDSDASLVFGVAMGDSWHPVGPVLARDGQGQLRVLLAGGGEALRLQRRQGLLLVSRATLPAAAVVIDLASGAQRTLDSSATSPAWVD